MKLEGTLEEIAQRLLETAKSRESAGLGPARATILVEETTSAEVSPDDFEKALADMQARYSVNVPNADYSREAMYDRNDE
jgi:hypothetical protein